MRLASTTSKGPPVVGSEPSRARTRRATWLRRALAMVASTAMGSMSTPTTRAAPKRAAATDRMPEPQPTSMTDAPSSRPASASRSRPTRQSRVVGWRPVPKAMPGSSAMTTSSATARCRRQVGRMTIRRPSRRTGKWRFQALAQSASWISRVCSSPMGRSPKAWRWPRSASTRAMAAAVASSSVTGR